MEIFLSQMIVEINKKRQALEEECKLLESLLKPWPKKKSVKNEEDPVVKITTTSEPDNAAYSLSHEEKQALLQVDELLQKAQKTRHSKPKNKSLMKDGNRQDSKSDIYDSKAPEHFSNQASENTVSDISARSHKTTKIQMEACKTSAVKGPPAANKLTKNMSNSTSQGANQSKRPSVSGSEEKTKLVAVTTSGKSAVSEPGLSNRQRNYRPSSAARSSRPSSGKGHHVPVHMTAPFKTDENIRFPKRRLNHVVGHKPGVRNVSKSIPVGGKTYKTLPSIKSSEQRKNSDAAARNSEELASKSVTPISASENMSQTSEGFDASDNDSDCLSSRGKTVHMNTSHKHEFTDNFNSNQNAASDIGSTLEGASAEEGEQLSGIEHSVCPDKEDSEQQWFSLKQNGSSLKLPGQLKKLVSVNNSLRGRCSAAGLVKKVSSGDPAQQFVEKLDAQGEMGQELWTRFSALTCLRSHQILLETLGSLHVDRISDSTPYEIIHRAQRVLQFVLSSFAEWQEEADYISRVQFRQLAPVRELHKTGKDPLETSWFDASEAKAGTQDEEDVQDHLHSSKHWAHLKFAEQYLKLYIAVVEAAQSEWWNALLSQKDPSVLQGVYSLLATSGQFLPTLVENPDFS